MNAAWAQPGLRDQETLAALAEEVVLGHTHVLIKDLGVAVAKPFVLAAHGGDVPQPLQARRVAGHDDHRRALVGIGLGLGHHHRDQKVGDHAVRREPFVPVDHPLVPIEHGRGGEQRRI